MGLSNTFMNLAAMLLACAVLASCNQTGARQEFSSKNISAGTTDEPVAKFVNVKAGSEEDLIMTVGRRVYFKAGSAEFDDVALETMNIQIDWLKRYPQWKVKLQGHADDPGGIAKNVQLSDKRARAVMDYFVKNGISQQRMWAKGYGSERLLRSCPELECKALNRRVVVNLRREFDAAAPQF